MKHDAYQVQIDGGLSKPYSIDRLRQARDAGQINNSSACTADGAKSWIFLGTLLEQAEASGMMSSTSQSEQSGIVLRGVDYPASGSHQQTGEESGFALPPTRMDGGHSASARASTSSVRDIAAASNPGPGNSSALNQRPSSGLHSRPSSPSSSQLSRRPAIDAEDDDSFVSGSHAAAKVLSEVYQKKSAKDQGAGLTPPSKKLPGQKPDRTVAFSFLAGVLGGIVVVAVSAFVIPGRAASENSDLTLAALGSANTSDWITNSKTQPMTPEELSAHVQIMGVQLRHVAKQVSVDVDTAPIYTLLETLSRRKLPLLAYSPSPSGNELQAEVDTLLRQYAKLVQAQGADGRKLDRKTVDLYSQRVARMMELVGTSNADRIEAVHDLAEKTKLLYLLQLNYARSKDSSLNESARQTVLQASNRGLEKLFAEFATGDMRYMDVFLAAEPEEQRELILIRYWCHRIGSVTAANTWLNQMNKLASSDDDDGASILASIAEVDAIENADVEF